MKKKNLLLFAALALSASASAQEVVTVTSTDGKKEFDKGQITTFTFDGPPSSCTVAVIKNPRNT